MRICIFLLTTLMMLSSTFGQEKEKDLSIEETLKTVIPEFKQNGKIKDVLKALKEISKKHDPEKKGLSIIYKPNLKDKDEANTYNFDFENMPLSEIIRYICRTSNKRYKIVKNSIVIASPNIPLDEMYTRFYTVNAGLDAIIAEMKGGNKAQTYFETAGVQFDAGTKTAYIESASRLVITNTSREHRRVEEILKTLMTEWSTVDAQLSRVRKGVVNLNADLKLLEELMRARESKKNLKAINEKLRLILPKVRFEGWSLEVIVDFLKRKTRELDPDKKGLNFIIKINKNVNQKRKVNLAADNIPVGEIIKYISEQLDLKYTVEELGVILSD